MKYFVQMKIVDFGNSIRAFADVTMCFTEGELTLRGFKVIHEQGKEPWVALPANSYKDKSGQYKNSPLVEIPTRIKEEIFEQILERYRELSR